MERQITLSLRTLYCGLDSVETLEESRHTGALLDAPDGLLICYADAALEDEPPSRVTLQLRGDTLFYRREGSSSVTATYREGVSCAIAYQTPYGEMEMRIHTSRLRWSFDGARGELFLAYQLLAEEEEISENRLEIAFEACARDG